jgi:hypothetical protein
MVVSGVDEGPSLFSAGSENAGTAVPVALDGGQPRASTMSVLFHVSVQLFVACPPAEDTIRKLGPLPLEFDW